MRPSVWGGGEWAQIKGKRFEISLQTLWRQGQEHLNFPFPQ
jgi:hypothetical protein